MRLDERISAIIAEVKSCSTVADIGCDHGIVAVTVAERALANKVIAADISAKSLDKARNLAAEYGVNIDFRVGDGLSVLTDGECDTVIIAGMGGMLMADIIKRDGRHFNRYILSPQSDLPYFRSFLSERGLMPVTDRKVLSQGKFYDIITAVDGEYMPNESQMLYGSGDGDDFYLFVDYERARLNFIIANAKGEKSDEARHYLSLLENMLALKKESKQ